MTTATKIVLVTVGVSAFLSLLMITTIALG